MLGHRAKDEFVEEIARNSANKSQTFRIDLKLLSNLLFYQSSTGRIGNRPKILDFPGGTIQLIAENISRFLKIP